MCHHCVTFDSIQLDEHVAADADVDTHANVTCKQSLKFQVNKSLVKLLFVTIIILDEDNSDNSNDNS